MASERNEPFLPDRELHPAEIPEGVDRRAFMMRSAAGGRLFRLPRGQGNRSARGCPERNRRARVHGRYR